MTPHEENWLALNLVERIGGKAIGQLIAHFGDIAAVLAAPPEAIAGQCRVTPELARRIGRAREVTAFRIEKRLVEEGSIRLIPVDCDDYPDRLKSVHLPPPLLYCRGRLPLAGGPVLAVVGTRAHTRYGEKATRHLIEGLAQAAPDAVIVSGLARGIDTVAHQQALDSGLDTFAVLGGGLSHVYPPENEALADRIAGQGALLSEFHMTQRPLAKNFPIRNRVISGLADAVLVVEAGEKSGALITAGFALNYERPVLALPGNIDQLASAGVNRLIQSGQARLVRDAADLVQALRGVRPHGPLQLNWLDSARAEPAPGGAVQQGEKGRILATLRRGPLHPDDLSGELELSIERLIGLLLELELSGEIVQTADNQYALA